MVIFATMLRWACQASTAECGQDNTPIKALPDSNCYTAMQHNKIDKRNHERYNKERNTGHWHMLCSNADPTPDTDRSYKHQ